MTVLVTGGLGCIGAWTLKHLSDAGEQAVCFDLGANRYRLDQLLTPQEQTAITFVQGDITDYAQVKSVFETHGITQVIHLAALQVPACKANPTLGAQVNVVGTTHIFEAARQTGVSHIAHASSIAVYGPPSDYPSGLLGADAPMLPRTLYGVYKVCNENTARIYWQDYGVSSIVLRPYTVYGVGRDQGLTSEPTLAMSAAAKGQDSRISFGGRMQFHFASDVARQFIHAAKMTVTGAYAFNMGMPPVAVADVAKIIMEIVPSVTVSVGDTQLPFPEGCDPAPLHDFMDTVYETDLRDGIRQTIEHYQRLLNESNEK